MSVSDGHMGGIESQQRPSRQRPRLASGLTDVVTAVQVERKNDPVVSLSRGARPLAAAGLKRERERQTDGIEVVLECWRVIFPAESNCTRVSRSAPSQTRPHKAALGDLISPGGP